MTYLRRAWEARSRAVRAAQAYEATAKRICAGPNLPFCLLVGTAAGFGIVLLAHGVFASACGGGLLLGFAAGVVIGERRRRWRLRGEVDERLREFWEDDARFVAEMMGIEEAIE